MENYQIENPTITHAGNKMIIRWKRNPFNISLSVLWRGVYIPVNIKWSKITNGETITATIMYENKEYSYSFSKYKYMGGGHGDGFPKITSGFHELHFCVTLFSLEFFDYLIEPDDSDNKDEKPFVVIYQS